MKILFGLSYYTPNISGLTIYVKNLAEALAENGHEVHILTSKHTMLLPSVENVNKVRITRLWTPAILGRGPIMPLYPISVLKEVLKTDIVNLHLPSFEAVFLGFWAKALGKKIVVTYHCDLANWSGVLNKITEAGANLSHIITLYLADIIVNSSEDYAKNSKVLKHFVKKTKYVYPPVKNVRSENRPLTYWQEIKYKIGYVGRITSEKGVEYLLKAIEILKSELKGDFKLFLVGPVKDIVGGGSFKMLRPLFTKYKKYIEILGKLSDADLFGFYKQIDVLVLPSVEPLEAFGMVQIEAMLSGCPVVATDMPGVRIPVKLTGMGRLVDPKSASNLAEGIINVLKNKEKYLGNKKLAEKYFAFQSVISFYERLFTTIS